MQSKPTFCRANKTGIGLPWMKELPSISHVHGLKSLTIRSSIPLIRCPGSWETTNHIFPRFWDSDSSGKERISTSIRYSMDLLTQKKTVATARIHGY